MCPRVGRRAGLTVVVTALLWAPATISGAQQPLGPVGEPARGIVSGATDRAAKPKDPAGQTGGVGGPGALVGPKVGTPKNVPKDKLKEKDPPKNETPKTGTPKPPPKTQAPKQPPKTQAPKDPPKNPRNDGRANQPKPKPKSGSNGSKKPSPKTHSPPLAKPRERPPTPRAKKPSKAKAAKPAPKKAKSPASKKAKRPASKKAKRPGGKGSSGQSTAKGGAAGPSQGLGVAQTTVTGNSFVSQDVRRRRAQVGPFATVRIKGRFHRRGARIRMLTVTAPRASTVTVRCRGRGCGARSQSRVVPAAAEQVPATKRLRFSNVERNLRAGTVIEVSVTQADAVGKFTRFVIRGGKPPLRRDLCLAPGSTRPTRCS